jgi:hypothetical protein
MDPFEALAAAAGNARTSLPPPPPPPPPLGATSAAPLSSAAGGVDPLAALTAALRVDGGGSALPPLPPPPPPPPPVHWADFPVPPPVSALFLEADADGDGQVGRADAKAFFLRTGVPGPILAKARFASPFACPRARARVRGHSGALLRARRAGARARRCGVKRA